MNTGVTGHRRPGAFSARPGSSPSIDSDDSPSSPPAARPRSREISSQRHPQHIRNVIQPNSTAASSTTSFSNFSRPGFARQTSNEPPSRNSGGEVKGHKRQHSQGFFEPSLPSASTNLSDQNAMSNLTASQIAAQAAMQHTSHSRQRSQTIPSPHSSPPSHSGTITGRRKPPPIQTGHEGRERSTGTPTGSRPYNGSLGSNAAAAATAANAVYPRQLSPSITGYEPPPPEREPKLKEQKSKMKLFSKPKDKSNKETNFDKPLPSPNKFPTSGASALSKLVNPSTTSLADSLNSGASSLYSVQTGNASTSTLVPSDRQRGEEKEKHKHHFLSRQKNKLRDRIADDHTLQLSSASSNSRPLDPLAPNTLYSFAPAPASPATTSFTGLDLRHAGKAVRDRKREEKSLPFAPKISDIDKIDFAGGPGRTTPGPSLFGPATTTTADLGSAGGGVGAILQNIRPEDAWDYLKAKLLAIFEGEEIRIPVEDLNMVLIKHIQRRIRTNNPTGLIEDLRDFLSVGFLSLDYTLRPVPETRLVPALVDTWLFIFGRVLPYIQAVFLPLDLEFKGHGTFLSARESADFWGADPSSNDSEAFGNAFDVRRIVLLAYRDAIILPRYEKLKSTFSRLSLESINPAASPSPLVDSFDTLTSSSSTAPRPGTAGSGHVGGLSESYNSQSSTLYDPSDSSRSRGNSNLSAPELPSFAPASTSQPSSSFQRNKANSNPRLPVAVPDSSLVTETVGRMLQCVSVLASTQSNDEAQRKMEDLARALKLNWLGRGRTGRNRRGIVGGKGGGFGGGLLAPAAPVTGSAASGRVRIPVGAMG